MMLLLQNSKSGPLKVLERVNPELEITYRGHEVEGDPDFDSPPHFKVVGSTDGEEKRRNRGNVRVAFDGDSCSACIRIGRTEADVTCTGSAEPYGPDIDGDESPEGPFFSRLPTGIVGLHWFVQSMGTPVDFTVRQHHHRRHRHHDDHDDQTSEINADDGGSENARKIRGRGWMHAEKNWGASFPKGWVWAQARDGESSFVLAGGAPPSPLVPGGWGPEVWLAAVHVDDALRWRLHPWDPTFYSIETEACGEHDDPEPFASFKFTATQPVLGRQVELFIKAPRGSFTPLDCPTEHGFAPYSDHSYAGSASMKLYTLKDCAGLFCKGVWSILLPHRKERVLIYERSFEDVALEFGGNKRCCASCSSSVGGEGTNGVEQE